MQESSLHAVGLVSLVVGRAQPTSALLQRGFHLFEGFDVLAQRLLHQPEVVLQLSYLVSLPAVGYRLVVVPLGNVVGRRCQRPQGLQLTVDDKTAEHKEQQQSGKGKEDDLT